MRPFRPKPTLAYAKPTMPITKISMVSSVRRLAAGSYPSSEKAGVEIVRLIYVPGRLAAGTPYAVDGWQATPAGFCGCGPGPGMVFVGRFGLARLAAFTSFRYCVCLACHPASAL